MISLIFMNAEYMREYMKYPVYFFGKLSIDYLMTPDLLCFLSTSFVRDDNFIKMPEFQLSCLNEFFKKFIVVLF